MPNCTVRTRANLWASKNARSDEPNCKTTLESLKSRLDQIPRAYSVVLIGNPGSGKSTLLNTLVKDAKFKSGVRWVTPSTCLFLCFAFSLPFCECSFGEGMTRTMKKVHLNGFTYIDAPGFDDADSKEDAAQEVHKDIQFQ